MRERGEKRKLDFIHALKKKNKSETHFCNRLYPYYNNLHQYSKNKIHCSCPDCSAKTREDGYKISDKRKIEELESQLTEVE